MIDFYSKAGVNIPNFTIGVLNSNIGSFLTKLFISSLPSTLIRFLFGLIELNKG